MILKLTMLEGQNSGRRAFDDRDVVKKKTDSKVEYKSKKL